MDESGRAKKPTRTERKKTLKSQRRAEENSGKAKERRSALARWIGTPIVVLSGLATVLYFYSQFSLTKETPLDPSQVFTTPFVLHYNGWVPLFDLKVSCRIDDVKTEGGQNFHDFSVQYIGDHLRVAWHDDVLTFPCQAIQGNIDTADIKILIDYRAPLLGHFSIDRRYVSARQSDGILRFEEAPTRAELPGFARSAAPAVAECHIKALYEIFDRAPFGGALTSERGSIG